MGYEERREAAGDYVAEHAIEMVRDGNFDDEIRNMIMNGNFDEVVKERMKLIEGEKKK